MAFSPNGRLCCSSTLDGGLHLLDVDEGVLIGSMDGRLDIAGGRIEGDRRGAGHAAAGRAFTSLEFSADGAFLLGGGNSKYVCVYDVQERVLLARFQISANKSLGGVLDVLNSKGVSEAGPLALVDDDSDREGDEEGT